MPENGVEIKIDRVKEMLDSVSYLTKNKVMVGTPAATAGRSGDPINNAAIGYINEYGSPAKNIPPRPWLYPPVNAMQDKAAAMLEKAADAVFDGKPGDAENTMNALGLLAVAEIRKFIVAGAFVPLAPRTLADRKRRKITSTKPLLATYSFWRAISYVVRKV
jgi:hypothetical protein